MLENKRKRVLIVVGLLIVCFLVIGVSYAVWNLTLTQRDKNVVTTGCFKVEFTDQNPITLNKAYPISDEEGKKLNTLRVYFNQYLRQRSHILYQLRNDY